MALTTAACQQSGGTAPPTAAAPSSSTTELAKKVQDLETELASLRGRVNSLGAESAEISTAGDGYGVARTKFGPFVVVGRGVTPHLDGYKVKLAVGNLTSATFHGAKVKVEWGPPFEAGRFAEYFKNRKEREFSVTSVLPGHLRRCGDHARASEA